MYGLFLTNQKIMSKAEEIIKELKREGSAQKAAVLQRFFKTGQGEYGEGDLFLGVKVPEIREVVKHFFARLRSEEITINSNKITGNSPNELSALSYYKTDNTNQTAEYLDIIELLLKSKYHEVRMASLFLLLEAFKKEKNNPEKQEQYVKLYLSHTEYINNWDLVDLSCPKILGPWFENRDRKILYLFAESGELWKERIAMVTCLYFIKKGDFTECKAFAERFMNHKHDLMHKAAGWMLREMGKKESKALTDFLQTRYKRMPRTMLRYAIEKFSEQERRRYLKGIE
jgi:3-methyladenine DNA glycosylase AlkD